MDFLDILFPGNQNVTMADVQRGLDEMHVEETRRQTRLKAEAAARLALPRCRRCGGTGRLSQFMHRNNGTCYDCGGSGNA